LNIFGIKHFKKLILIFTIKQFQYKLLITNEKILLAEDDIDFGAILKQYLELQNFSVIWAKDGEEALELFKTNSFDICVLDVMMPKIDGFTLAEKIVDNNPEIPFVFLTARNQNEDKIKGLKLGADDYIVKPFEADELVLRLTNIIKRTEKEPLWMLFQK